MNDKEIKTFSRHVIFGKRETDLISLDILLRNAAYNICEEMLNKKCFSIKLTPNGTEIILDMKIDVVQTGNRVKGATCDTCDFKKAIAKTFDIHIFGKEDCPYYIRNVHDRGDDSLCRYLGKEV